MMEDLKEGSILRPSRPQLGLAEETVRGSKPEFFSYEDWRRLDEIELARGKELNRPRLKFTCVEDMKTALGR
jgi:hypothetical protein